MKTLLLLVTVTLLGLSASYGQTAAFKRAKRVATTEANRLKVTEDKKRNVWTDKDGVIHLFMFENGSLLLSGYPTTATDKDKFQLHFYTTKDEYYTFEAAGTYEPTLLPDEAATKKEFNMPSPDSIKIYSYDFSIVGPFTNSVTFTVKRSSDDISYASVNASTIKISNRAFVSIGSGFFYTPLKSPSNIHAARRVNGDSVLVADNTHGYSSLAVMATFYPRGRNSLMMPRSWYKQRFGIIVGTNIASSTANFKNWLVGASYDFAYGGSVVAGVNVDTQRQRILDVDYRNFTFGETIYKGRADGRLYKETAVSVFFGVQVDSRIFIKLFPGSGK